MLHDAALPDHNPGIVSDVDEGVFCPEVGPEPSPDDSLENPWEGWTPGVEETPLVLDEEILELELADPDEGDGLARRMGTAGTVVSLLFHAWLVVNLSGLFLEPTEDRPYIPLIATLIDEPTVEELDEVIDYELANPDERELEVREVINATSVGVAQNDAPKPEAAPTPLLERPPTELQQTAYDIPEGIEVDDRVVVKGAIGESVVQLESALDLVTWEIANNLKEHRLLVVWLLDASSSLNPKRQIIQKRLRRIYGELNALERIGQLPMREQPMLSAVVSYGQRTNYLTKTPTDRFSKIEKAFGEVKTDVSGKENVFTAVCQVMNLWGHYRGKQGRRILLVAITDEAGDDHGPPLEVAINRCRRRGAKAYVIGPSAPFGARKGYVPYVAPENGKTYQLPVDLGPEAAIPDHISLPFWFSGPQYDRPPLSSGFAPYALARLVSETGGMYFMTNMTTMAGLAPLGRFDAAALRPFEPDYSYSSPQDCLNDVMKHPLRMAVYNAAMISRKFRAGSTPSLSIRVTPQNFKHVASEA
ncbi:MAG: vWA domain-containing protein, partial [Planctomycetaceae bacterium]